MSTTLFSTLKEKGDLYLASSLCDGLEDNDLKQVTTLLKSKEANPNVFMPLRGITPFHLVIGNDSEAFAEEVTKLFLQYGGNPNVKSIDAMTPVHVAAAWGRIKILKLLLANGGDPLYLDLDNCSPFHYAFQGEHYEAVSVLSEYCINGEDEDLKPKFKLELDKILFNNGNTVAEYVVSNDMLFDTTYKYSSLSSDNSENSKISTTGYAPESDSADLFSINSDFITIRKNQIKRVVEEEINYINNIHRKGNKIDLYSKTLKKEKHLINEFISNLSSSFNSKIGTNDATLINYENRCLNKKNMNLPKRRQIKMTFNRPKQYREYSKSSEKQTVHKKNSILQVIKQHNYLPYMQHNKILTNNYKKLETEFHDNILNINKWFDEPIISKSPNLIINDHVNEKQKNLIKDSVFGKKEFFIQPKFIKKSSIITNKSKCRSSVIHNNSFSPINQPRSKKYTTNSCNSKLTKTSKEMAPKTIILNKPKLDSSKIIPTIEKFRSVNRFNNTFSKAESSTSRSNKKLQKIENRKEIFKNVTKQLDNCIKNNSNKCSCSKKNNMIKNNLSNFRKEFTDIHSESDLVSAIDTLDSYITLKSDFKFMKEEEKIIKEMDIDLNQAILNSFSYMESINEKSDNKNENFQNLDKSIKASDSLICIKSSLLSESSDSFISLTQFDNICDTSNDTESNNHKNVESLLFLKNNLTSYQDDCSSYTNIGIETFFSMEEEYKYQDLDESIDLRERRLCVSPSSISSEMNTSFFSCSTEKSEPLPKEIFFLDNVTLRKRLKNLGENPGPITNTTHCLYLKHLHKVESQGRKVVQQSPISFIETKYYNNLEEEKKKLKSLQLSTEWIKSLDEFEVIEQKVFQEFANPTPSRKWREGNSKNSFNYLLLDPRITKDLPRRANKLSLKEKWETFLSAIFYVGKGKQSRPYAHLYDAFKLWVSHNQQNITSMKIQRIMDIWNEGEGVIVLHLFHNTIPVEAYTREAAMIEILGTQKLGNCKYGNYYGIMATWRIKEKCELGKYLLFKALQILLVEGERQIFPDNL